MKIRVALCGILGMLATHASLAGDCNDLTLPSSVVDFAYAEHRDQPQRAARVVELLARALEEKMQLPGASQGEASIFTKRFVERLLASSKSASELRTGLAEEAAVLCKLASRQPSSTVQKEAVADAKTVVGKLKALSTETKVMDEPFERMLGMHMLLFDRRSKPASADQLWLDKNCGKENHASFQCSRKLFAVIQRNKRSMEKNLEMAKALNASADQTVEIEMRLDEKMERYKEAVEQEVLRAPFYGLYAGPSFLLNEEGGFDEGLEVFASFNTGASQEWWLLKGKFTRGVFDARFLSESAFPSEAEEGEGLPVDVFKSTGELRLRARGQVHMTDLFGLELGLGATSLASEDSSFSRVEPRLDLGLRFQTSYPDRAIGELVLGYSRDESWRRRLDTDGDLSTTADQVVERQFDRYFVEGSLLFPNLELGGFSLAARLSANFPTSGSSPSELRASILLYYPFNAWLEKFKPGVAKPAP